jgi:outer membrane lipoprotein SlyB
MLKRAFSVLAAALLAVPGCMPAPMPVAQKGVILAAAPADQAGQNTGTGAIVGMVLLGAAGGSVGSGVGKALAISAGVVAGAAAGTAAEAANQPRDGVAYTIQLAGGQVVTLIQHLDNEQQALPPGSKVTLETNGDAQQIVLR